MLLDEEEALRRIDLGGLRCKGKLRQLAAGPALNFETTVLAFTARAAKGKARIEFGFVWPNVRAKLATTAWRAGQAAQNGAKPQRRMASVTRRWRSA